jgi:hypothetical protein
MDDVTQNRVHLGFGQLRFRQMSMATDEKRKASPDYERPEQNVADIPDPVVLPPNKARQAVLVRGMWLVLTISTALAAAAMLIAYFVL